jgi:hypothetical protein|tara:strand:- start:327 stop:512 length:186 start_codon:yes stop_codon:yes gene_type:complete
MEKLWNKFLAWLSGWPEGVSEENKIKEEFIDQSVKESQARKVKKAKGLTPKKKKKAKKQSK